MSVRVLALSAFQSCAVLFSSPPPSRLLPCRAASSHARRASAAFGPGSRCSAPVSFHRGPHTIVPANMVAKQSPDPLIHLLDGPASICDHCAAHPPLHLAAGSSRHSTTPAAGAGVPFISVTPIRRVQHKDIILTPGADGTCSRARPLLPCARRAPLAVRAAPLSCPSGSSRGSAAPPLSCPSALLASCSVSAGQLQTGSRRGSCRPSRVPVGLLSRLGRTSSLVPVGRSSSASAGQLQTGSRRGSS